MFDLNAVVDAMAAMAKENKLTIEAVDCDLVVQINGVRVGVPVISLDDMTTKEAAEGVLGAWAAHASESKLN